MNTLPNQLQPPQLTIAIPTYARNDKLNATLRILLPQLTPDCRLLILDNASPTPVSETIGAVTGGFPEASVSVVRNRANVGMCANITRCFEHCETPWLWLLGDDDKPLPDAVATVLRHTREHADCLFVNFSSEISKDRAATRVTRGLDGFVDGLDSYGNIMLLSNCMYRVNDVLPHLRIAYHYIYSMGPHVAILLPALGDDGPCCLSVDRVVSWQPNTRSDKWSWVHLGLGATTLVELCPRPETRAVFARKIASDVSITHLFQLLVFLAVRQGNVRDARYPFDQICSRLLYFERRPWLRMRAAAFRAVLRLPIGLLTLLLRGYCRVKGIDLGAKHAGKIISGQV